MVPNPNEAKRSFVDHPVPGTHHRGKLLGDTRRSHEVLDQLHQLIQDVIFVKSHKLELDAILAADSVGGKTFSPLPAFFQPNGIYPRQRRLVPGSSAKDRDRGQ